jgi:hypothetical protein
MEFVHNATEGVRGEERGGEAIGRGCNSLRVNKTHLCGTSSRSNGPRCGKGLRANGGKTRNCTYRNMGGGGYEALMTYRVSILTFERSKMTENANEAITDIQKYPRNS